MTENVLALANPSADVNSEFVWKWVPEDTIVTRNLDGSPASLLRDDTWDLAAYARNQKIRKISFRKLMPADANPFLASTSKTQVKQVMYILMHHASDDMPAPATLKDWFFVIRKFCYFSGVRGKDLYTGLENTETVLSFIQQDGAEIDAQKLHSILVHLHRLGKAKTGVEIPLKKLHGPMLARFRERPGTSQHPVIPTRIYQHFIATCEMELGMAEKAADELVQEMRRLYAGKTTSDTISPSLNALLSYFGKDFAPTRISSLLAEIGLLCEILVITFTGMRRDEAAHLPFNCLKVVHQDGVPHYSIEGITTKLSGGRVKQASWVTSHLAARAVKLAQKLFGEVHKHFGTSDYLTSTDGTYLLFCRTGISMSRYELGRGLNVFHKYENKFRSRTFLSISKEDIEELKLIDPFRSWEEEPDFEIGSVWPFTRHQLRRTLALYAQRSGLVTLPSLKRQLQHITMEMSMYYARGSAFAKDFLETNKNHFAKEWAENQGLSEYLGYAAQVLFSDERLFGGHVAWAKSGSVQESPVSVYSRSETLKMFERGQLAYKETVLGGCASTEACKSSPLNWLPLHCLESNCKNLVVVPSKLQRVIKAQQRRVEVLRGLGEDSVEHRIEKDTLEVLLATEAKVCSEEGIRQ